MALLGPQPIHFSRQTHENVPRTENERAIGHATPKIGYAQLQLQLRPCDSIAWIGARGAALGNLANKSALGGLQAQDQTIR
jgi:hypothetical protein